MTGTDVIFEAPGPGAWELDATHRGRRPLSPFLRPTLESTAPGFTVLVERYGLPLDRVEAKLVQGCLYFRPIGIGEGDTPKAPPPAWIMKVATRLHPALRRRNRAAAQAWEQKRWRQEVDDWFDRDRATVVATNVEFGRVDLSALDDDALIEHVGALLAHFGTQARRNLETHGGDLIPTGDFIAHCRRWGIADAEATALLRGSSPATVETAEMLAPVAKAIADAGGAPDSIEAVRALGPDAEAAVDTWREQHGFRLVTSDDIDKPTLAERPNLQLAALLAAANAPTDVAPPDAGPIRAKVPAAERSMFDALLVEARYGMRQRDDNAGVRWNWSGGLLRRALLELGDRLAARGALDSADHVVECTLDELGPLLLTGAGPSTDEVSARAAHRDLVEAARAPDTLGDPEDPPPLDVFPAPLARATAAFLTVMEAEGLASAPTEGELTGTGIGDRSYRGVARVASSVDDALDRLEPGDVLVAPFTGPAYNSIIPILGALVVDAGGAMCHAAIVAREFSLPAVVGATGATKRIPDGATVEVDPVAGRVHVID
ncbi:MAG: PEP-utilizing enzyme [Actinomycetota bacterium]|nr:PEP-utilizing enzyme [Actinomycetota bacterium]